MSAKVVQLHNEPYHYRTSGLDNVYLKNGFVLQDIDGYGETVSFDYLMELHECINQILCTARYRLTGKELKFLRKDRGISRKRMALCLDVANSALKNVESKTQFSSLETRIRAICISEEPIGYAEFLSNFELTASHERPIKMIFQYSNRKWQLTKDQ